MKLYRNATIASYERQIESLKKDLVHLEFHRNLIVRQIEQRDAELKVLREENERWAELVRQILFGDSLDDEQPQRTETRH